MTDGLRLELLRKRFGEVVALDGLSLHVPRGSLVGFLGPNGAGKTTAMRSVMGMVRPDAGTISWDGSPLDDAARKRVGYMPQERGLYARMKALEQIVYFGRLAGLDASTADQRANYWLERLDLSDRRDALLQELSGGNQQRVQLAVALIHDPDLLILDEPFAGLDPVAATKMQEIVTERTEAGACVLFSSHQLDLVSTLTRDAIVVAKGAVVAEGTIDELRSRSPLRRLRVRWSQPVAGFTPVVGQITESDQRSATIELDAATDPEPCISQAMAAGQVESLTMEPPELSELFADLVGAGTEP